MAAITLDIGGNTRRLDRDIQRTVNRAYTINLRTKGDQPLGRITGQVNEFNKSLAASNARVIAFGASAGIIYGLERAFSALVKATIEVQKSLQDINVILNVSTEQLNKFGGELFNIARNTGQSFQAVATAATEFSRQGLGFEETLKRTNEALILSRLSGLDTTKSVEALTAAVNSFASQAVTATEVVNKFANVDAAFAVSSKDLAEALARVGSSAAQSGVSLNELIAIVTAAQQTTARGGAVIGNSFKTIFTRLQRSKVVDLLGNLGISETDSSGQLKSTIQLLQDLGKVYDTLGARQQAEVAERVGGVFQINILKAALADLGKEYSIYNSALKVAASTTDEAIRRNEELNKTYAAQVNALQENARQLASSTGTRLLGPSIDRLVGGTNVLLKGFSESEGQGVGAILGKGILDGLGQFLAGPGIILIGGVLIKIFRDLGKFAAGSIQQLLGLNTSSTQQRDLQQSISQILAKNPQLINLATKSQQGLNQVANSLLLSLQKQTVELQKQAQISAQISKAYLGAGVRMSGGVPITPVPKNAGKASGYIPNFSTEVTTAKKLGATSSVKSVSGIGKIEGKSFEANNQEYQIPNFLGTQETAVIPKYGNGIQQAANMIANGESGSILDKSNRKKSRAGGFVPNFAVEGSELVPGLDTVDNLRKKASRSGGLLQNLYNVGEKNIFDQYKRPSIKRIPLSKNIQEYTKVADKYIKDIRNRALKYSDPSQQQKFATKAFRQVKYEGVNVSKFTDKVKPETLLNPQRDVQNNTNIKGAMGEIDSQKRYGVRGRSAEKQGDLFGADFLIKKQGSNYLVESKVTKRKVPDNVLIAKALQYEGQIVGGRYKKDQKNSIDNLQLKNILLSYAPYKNFASGYIPNFALPKIPTGKTKGTAQRLGYIDGDELRNPRFKGIVDSEMQKLSLKSYGDYHTYLTNMAMRQKKLDLLFAPPGTGKTTLAQGGIFKKPTRAPVLRPSDIAKFDKIVDTRAKPNVDKIAGIYAGGANKATFLLPKPGDKAGEERILQNRIDRARDAIVNPQIAQGRDPGTLSSKAYSSAYAPTNTTPEVVKGYISQLKSLGLDKSQIEKQVKVLYVTERPGKFKTGRASDFFASGFIPNFAKASKTETVSLGDISSNRSYSTKLLSVVIPQPSKSLLKFPAEAKYRDTLYTTTGLPVSGPNLDVTKKLSKQNIPNLHKNIGKVIVDQANVFGQSLGATKFISSVSQLPNLGGVNSAAGVAFEGGVTNALGQSVGSKNARVDFTSKALTPKIRKIFNNAPGSYEAKNRPSRPLINDAFLKFLSRAQPGSIKSPRSGGFKEAQELRAIALRNFEKEGRTYKRGPQLNSAIEKEIAKIRSNRGKAAGFIPNFANIQAIQNLLRPGSGATTGEMQAAQAALNRIQSNALRKLGPVDKLIKFRELLYGKKSNAGFNLDAIKIKDLNYKPLTTGAKELGLTKKDLELLASNPLAITQLRNFNPQVNNRSKFLSSGFIPNFAEISKVMALETAISGEKAIFDTKPFPHIRNKSQPTFGSAMADHGGKNRALKDSLRGQKKAGLLKSSGYIPNFAIEDPDVKSSGIGEAITAITAQLTGLAFAFAFGKDQVKSALRELAASTKAAASAQRNATKKQIQQRKAEIQKPFRQEAAQKLRAERTQIREKVRANVGAPAIGPLTQKQQEQYQRQLIQANKKALSATRGTVAQQTSTALRQDPILAQQRQKSKKAASPNIFKQAGRGIGANAFGLAIAAPILGETLKNVIGQETKGQRIAGSGASALGQIGTFAATGGLIGQGPGAAVGAVIGALLSIPTVVEGFTSNVPELTKAASEASQELTRFQEATARYFSSLEKLNSIIEDDGANSKNAEAARKEYIAALSSLSVEEQKALISAQKLGTVQEEYAKILEEKLAKERGAKAALEVGQIVGENISGDSLKKYAGAIPRLVARAGDFFAGGIRNMAGYEPNDFFKNAIDAYSPDTAFKKGSANAKVLERTFLDLAVSGKSGAEAINRIDEISKIFAQSGPEFSGVTTAEDLKKVLTQVLGTEDEGSIRFVEELTNEISNLFPEDQASAIKQILTGLKSGTLTAREKNVTALDQEKIGAQDLKDRALAAKQEKAAIETTISSIQKYIAVQNLLKSTLENVSESLRGFYENLKIEQQLTKPREVLESIIGNDKAPVLRLASREGLANIAETERAGISAAGIDLKTTFRDILQKPFQENINKLVENLNSTSGSLDGSPKTIREESKTARDKSLQQQELLNKVMQNVEGLMSQFLSKQITISQLLESSKTELSKVGIDVNRGTQASNDIELAVAQFGSKQLSEFVKAFQQRKQLALETKQAILQSKIEQALGVFGGFEGFMNRPSEETNYIERIRPNIEEASSIRRSGAFRYNVTQDGLSRKAREEQAPNLGRAFAGIYRELIGQSGGAFRDVLQNQIDAGRELSGTSGGRVSKTGGFDDIIKGVEVDLQNQLKLAEEEIKVTDDTVIKRELTGFVNAIKGLDLKDVATLQVQKEFGVARQSDFEKIYGKYENKAMERLSQISPELAAAIESSISVSDDPLLAQAELQSQLQTDMIGYLNPIQQAIISIAKGGLGTDFEATDIEAYAPKLSKDQQVRAEELRKKQKEEADKKTKEAREKSLPRPTQKPVWEIEAEVTQRRDQARSMGMTLEEFNREYKDSMPKFGPEPSKEYTRYQELKKPGQKFESFEEVVQNWFQRDTFKRTGQLPQGSASNVNKPEPPTNQASFVQQEALLSSNTSALGSLAGNIANLNSTLSTFQNNFANLNNTPNNQTPVAPNITTTTSAPFTLVVQAERAEEISLAITNEIEKSLPMITEHVRLALGEKIPPTRR
jgi:TP901 family phage tail tape measure protein